MEDVEARRRAAAEARRAKVLARGGDRLAQITGSVAAEPGPAAGVQSEPAQPTSPAPPAAAAAAATAAAEASLADEFGAAVRKSASAQSLPDQQRAKGTATNSKWAQYDSAAPRQRRRLRAVHAGETLSAAVLSTGRLRLALAALLALLLAAHWDAAAVARASSGVATAAGAPAPGPLAEIASRVQGLLHQAREAAAPLLGMQSKEQAAAAAAAKQCHQLFGPALDRLQGQVAAAAAAAAAQQEPLGAGQQLRARLVRGVSAAAGGTCRLYGEAHSQVAAVRSGSVSPAQAARAAAAAAVQHLHSQLAAVAAAPLGQQVLAAVDRLPPLASLMLLDLSLVGAAAAAMAAAPGLVHSTLELDLQTPGLVMRLAGWVPGLAQQLSLASGAQRLVAGLLDDAAAFVVALVAYQQLPQLLAGGGGSA